MKDKVNDLKIELLKVLESTPLSQINTTLNGRNGVRCYSTDIDGYYCNNSEESLNIVGKDGLTLTIEIDLDDPESEEIFENTQEYEDGMEFDDWDGTYKVTLDENSGIILLLELLKLT